MKRTAECATIRLPHPFRIAHGSSDTRTTILVHLEDEERGLIGHGEGALPPYYPSTPAACLQWLEGDLDAAPPPEAAAAAVALEIACRDLEAQRAGQPLWQLWGLDPQKIPPCARTLSIPLGEEELRTRLAEGSALGSTHFKLKLGSGDLDWDLRVVALAAEVLPAAHFSIDVNSHWSPEELLRALPALSSLTYIEQPLAADWSAWEDFHEQAAGRSYPPLVADESIQKGTDLATARRWCDGVNVKLLKAGGLSGAREWITEARSLGLRVMIGCMVETGIGRTAAAQLAPLADWLDIDPPDAIPFAPLSGIALEGDKLRLSARPGLGLEAV